MQRRRQSWIAAAALGVVLLIAVICALSCRGGKDAATDAARLPATAAPAAQSEAAGDVEAVALVVTPAPTPEPTPEPTPISMSSLRAAGRPTPTAPGFLPVFTSADTEEKIIAITVDDCFQADNLQRIVDVAVQYGGRLTIFPIGKNAIKKEQSATLRYAWENGCELENHTYTHNGLYNCSDEELAREVYVQQLTLCYVLDLEYQPHFLRPRGGDARRDQRMQKYAEQLGYYGIAHWSCDGSRSTDRELAKALKPGAIYLFHTTNNDLDKLERFIPWAVQQGYELVTLNEMFGYPDNETSPLTVPVLEHEVPPLEPYDRVLVTYKKTSYAYGVLLLQEKLIQLGYLSGTPDGVYGDGCVDAVKAFQRDHGLEVTGVADPEVQQMIFDS